MSLKLPKLNQLRTRQEGVTAFAGLNRNLRIRDNEFADMRNISSALLPVASARQRRRKLRILKDPNGLFAHEKLCWADGTAFYYNGVKKGTLTGSEKQFVRMGAYVLIFPDKAYYNTHTDEFGKLDAAFTGSVSAALCKLDGDPYGSYATGDTEPESPKNGDLWLDTGGDVNVLKQYAAVNQQWITISTVYTKLSAPGICKAFSKHDGLEITGFTQKELNGSFYLVDAAADWVIIVALIEKPETAAGVKLQRKVPDMDFVVEHGNRLWGCSSEKHEIYASALGDPKNWNQYLGVASDSYAVTVGSTGPFTGAASHLGFILFFKQDCVHQILGSKPSNFQLDTTNCRGVAEGSERSLVRVNETLFYHATDEVCAFNSAMPSGISNALGQQKYRNAIGGGVGSRYYLSLENESGERELYVFDTKQGVWMREDSAAVRYFAAIGDTLYMLDAAGGLWQLTGNGSEYEDAGTEDEPPVEWMLETGDIGYERQAAQYVGAIQLHASCQPQCPLYVDIRYEGSGPWHTVYKHTPMERRSMVVPIIPRRARLIRLRIRGSGDFRLYSLTMRVETGSDQYAAW
jgi:hypothetical protein